MSISVLIKQCEYKCLSGCLCLFGYVHVCTSYQCLSILDLWASCGRKLNVLKGLQRFNILIWNKTNQALARQYVQTWCRKNSMKTSEVINGSVLNVESRLTVVLFILETICYCCNNFWSWVVVKLRNNQISLGCKRAKVGLQKIF